MANVCNVQVLVEPHVDYVVPPSRRADGKGCEVFARARADSRLLAGRQRRIIAVDESLLRARLDFDENRAVAVECDDVGFVPAATPVVRRDFQPLFLQEFRGGALADSARNLRGSLRRKKASYAIPQPHGD